MTSTTKTDELLRIDERGRVRVSKARRAELLAEYDRSGLSGAAFARWAGMKYPTLANWLQQRRRAGAVAPGAVAPAQSANEVDAAATAPDPTPTPTRAAKASEPLPVAWAEVIVRDASAAPSKAKAVGSALCLRLPGGASLELDGSREALRLAAELLRELERTGLNRGGATC